MSWVPPPPVARMTPADLSSGRRRPVCRTIQPTRTTSFAKSAGRSGAQWSAGFGTRTMSHAAGPNANAPSRPPGVSRRIRTRRAPTLASPGTTIISETARVTQMRRASVAISSRSRTRILSNVCATLVDNPCTSALHNKLRRPAKPWHRNAEAMFPTRCRCPSPDRADAKKPIWPDDAASFTLFCPCLWSDKDCLARTDQSTGSNAVDGAYAPSRDQGFSWQVLIPRTAYRGQ